MPQPSADPPPESRPPESLQPIQRTAAYAVTRDRDGRVLLVRASPRSDLAGHWFLPGGGLRHGEVPADAVRRELLEETGLRVPPSAVRPLAASGDVIDLPHRGASLHTVRLVFEVSLAGNGRTQDPPEDLHGESDGTSDLVRFVSLQDAAALPVIPFAAELLGLPVHPLRISAPERPEPLVDEHSVPVLTTRPGEGPDETDRPARPGPGDDGVPPVRVQRPAAYAVLVDGDPFGRGRILLSKLTGSELWTLPGGGIDHGESPLVALEREVHEEAGLPYTAGPLLDISSRHFTGRAPTGRLEDFHGIRLLYGGSVPTDTPPHVVDVGGSSDDAEWFGLRDLGRIATVASVRHGLRMLRRATSGR